VSGEHHRSQLFAAVIGFALAGTLILGLGFWVANRPTASLPALSLISPRHDTLVDGPLKVQFETNVTLRLQPTGWGSGRYHVHALLDSTELMPAAGDLKALGSNRYEWIMPAPQRPHRLQLVWALPNHARLATGSSAIIQIAPALMPIPAARSRN
jgi:hypothetical protein